MPKKKLPIKMSAGFGLSMLDRAIKESFAARCGVIDLDEIERFFSRNGALHCAYCDDPNPTRWDHLHPVSLGGDTVPGNLVPACAGCDDSKQNRTLEEWALSFSKRAPPKEKVKVIQSRLEEYQRHFSYEPREFLQKLTERQQEQYFVIQEQMCKLRDLLIDQGFLKAKRKRGTRV